MYPQQFPCGPQSSCCGSIGQTEQEIENLKAKINEELDYKVEVFDVTNPDIIRNYEQVFQLLASTGPGALPILTIGDDIVSMGRAAPSIEVETIREKASQLQEE